MMIRLNYQISKNINFLILVLLLIMVCGCGQSETVPDDNSTTFYVDIKNGDDSNSGDIEHPLRTLDRALEIVANRVEKGIRSDKIYLREGRYKKVSQTTLWWLELKGTQDDYAVLSAMPCEEPNTPGCVQRKSGKWYEKVIFDDGYEIETSWEKIPGKRNIWKTNLGYTRLEWTHQNLWPWTTTEKGFPLTKNDGTPETTLFTVAPYMVLQDGAPLKWAQYVDSLTAPGMRSYNHQTGELFVWPLNDKDPNNCKWESWYGGPQDYEAGTLHLDGEGRALFDGNLEYAAIRGFEFYMFSKIFELHRRKYDRESERVIQHNILLEDNLFRYGWIHVLLDANTVNDEQGELILPRYHDRSSWTARNNVFFRPSRECFQLHGNNHVFEYNTIIDHLGPWAGPAACVSAVNTRNTRNALIRNNYISGHGKNKWHHGSVFMIEVDPNGNHTDSNGDYIYGGQTYENNLFEDITGPALVLGKGGARMKDITVRNNIFKTGNKSSAIRLSSPYRNLVIDNNIFYDQNQAIGLAGGKEQTSYYRSMPSSISIRNNIFASNRKTIEPELLTPHESSRLYVENNLFYNNQQPVSGEQAVTREPMFRNPEKLDFRPAGRHHQRNDYSYIGPYPYEGSYIPGTDWWNIVENIYEE